MNYTLGSLFDGSGGFPLAGTLCGIEPRWASEVEPYPIAVTRSRFPNMHHLGDISKVDGAKIEPVDIITFGSPCQDLSVAGKRAGLKHEANGDDETTRSGLFMEAVRIIKEMREATNGKYPRFAIWENVPGAFSSNNGEDFRIVCEELIKVVEPGAFMPPVPAKGWAYADCYTGDGWSLAYRVFDAQYWGVPQRRRRIHLIVDFRGERAHEILFEREGLRGYFETGRTPWQETAGHAGGSPATDDRSGTGDNGDGHTASTITGDHENRVTDYTNVVLSPTPIHDMTTRFNGRRGNKADGKGNGLGVGEPDSAMYTLTAGDRHGVVYATDVGFFSSYENQSPTLLARQYKDPYLVTYPENEVQYIVRRLTPTECARLQGFADWWGYIEPKTEFTMAEYRFWLDVRNIHATINGKVVKDYTERQMLTWYNKLYTDSAEYKMWGNGMALPPALYCIQGIVDALNRTEPETEPEDDEAWML